MKKRIFSLLMIAVLLLGSLSMSACQSGNSLPVPPEGTMTRVTVDINPGIELMVDDENKVISVTALNDDAGVLLAGEELLGKTPEEVTERILSLATDLGYLSKGEDATEENTVQISVSGDSKYAEALTDALEERITASLETLDIAGAVRRVEALEGEALRALAQSTSLYTEEELAAMSREDLYRVIAAGRIETAQLLTQEMREAYYAAKEYKISFAQREETAKVIEAMGGIYTLVHAGYKTALDLYSQSITALDSLRYEMLISPESEYQKSLAALREAKAEVLEQRAYVVSLQVNGEDCGTAEATLQLREEQYEAALAAYEQMGTAANAALENLIQTLRSCETKLIELEESFSDDIKAELTAKAGEIEASVNATKDAFFAAFEAEHKEDIQAMEAALLQQKQALLASVDAEK
ncbi:MAG: hypothetical protein IJX28_05930 [Clostridia bacterium]|nr:hypothetical protein [Clostridia bacterium]